MCVCWPTSGYDLFNRAFERPLVPIPDSMIPTDVRDSNITDRGMISSITYRLDDEADRDFVNFLENQYNAKYYDATKNTDPNNVSVSFHFARNGKCGRCPYGVEHQSNGFYVNVYKDGDAFFRCLGGECKDKKMYHIGNKEYMVKCRVKDDDDAVIASLADIPEVNTQFDYTCNHNEFKNFLDDAPRIEDNYGVHIDPVVFDIFSKFHVKCDSPSGHVVYKLEYANDGVPRIPKKWDLKSLKETFSGVKVDVLGKGSDGRPKVLKNQDFLRAWEAHSTVYDALTMMPNKPFGPYTTKSGKAEFKLFNLWAGIYSKINYDALDDKNIDLVDEDLEFVWDLIKAMCNDDDQIHRYFLNWLWLTMNGRKTGKVICLINSAGGIGKGVLLDFLRNCVFGTHVSGRETRDSILGCFNGSLQDKLFVMMDEIETLRHDEVQRLKSLITETSITIHKKNETATTSDDNYLNFIITSNFPFHHDDRRFVKIQPSDRLKDTVELIQFAEKEKKEEWRDAIGVKFWLRVCEYVNTNPIHINKVPKTNDPRGMMNAPKEMIVFDRIMNNKYQAVAIESRRTKKGEVAPVNVDNKVCLYQIEVEREVAEEFSKSFPGAKYNHHTFNGLLTNTFKCLWKTRVDTKSKAREVIGYMPSYREYNDILMKKKWLSEEDAALLNTE